MITMLCIHGSERPQGNTRLLMEEAIKGAKAKGARIERIIVSDLNIGPCVACDECHEGIPCIEHDDMEDVYPLLKTCDRFLIAAPIYFLSLPGRLKCVVDRCQVFWHKKYVLGQKVAENPSGVERIGAFISVCGNPKADRMFEPAERIVRALLNCLDAKLAHTLYVPGLEGPTDVLARTDVMQQARAIGEALAAR